MLELLACFSLFVNGIIVGVVLVAPWLEERFRKAPDRRSGDELQPAQVPSTERLIAWRNDLRKDILRQVKERSEREANQ